MVLDPFPYLHIAILPVTSTPALMMASKSLSRQ